MNLRTVRPGFLVFLIVALVSSVAFAQSGEKHLRWAISVGVGSLDPHSIQGSSDRIIVENVFSGLVRHKPGTVTQVDPDLAYHWTVSPDGLTYTFFLRNNAVWHDGYGPVTAHDVKYSWDRVLDPETPGSANSTLAVVDSIEVLDDFTVQVNLSRPHLPFLIDIAHAAGTYIVNEQAVNDLGEDFRFQPIGSGPYRVVQAESRGGAELEAFDQHWDGRPRIDRVTMQVVPDETVATLALIDGELDYAIVRDPINIVDLLGIQEGRRAHPGEHGPGFRRRHFRPVLQHHPRAA